MTKIIREILRDLPPRAEWVRGDKLERNGHQLQLVAHVDYSRGGVLNVYRCPCGVIAALEFVTRQAPMMYTPLAPCPLAEATP